MRPQLRLASSHGRDRDWTPTHRLYSTSALEAEFSPSGPPRLVPRRGYSLVHDSERFFGLFGRECWDWTLRLASEFGTGLSCFLDTPVGCTTEPSSTRRIRLRHRVRTGEQRTGFRLLSISRVTAFVPYRLQTNGLYSTVCCDRPHTWQSTPRPLQTTMA
eukprot:1191938-Prorocentrum_minimum.AAC.6